MINKTQKAFSFITNFFVLAGGLYFLGYSVISSKFFYIVFVLLIYLLSYILRKFVIKTETINGLTYGFTELGMFFLSSVFVAYTLYFTDIDREIVEYLPDSIMNQSGIIVIILFLQIFIVKETMSILRFAILLVVIFVIVQFNHVINSLFLGNSWLTTFFIGTPYIYLLLLLTGTYHLRKKMQPSK